MKVEPEGFGTLVITAETDADRVWLAQYLEGFPRDHMPFLSNYIRVDSKENDKEDEDIEEVVGKPNDDWIPLIDKIELKSYEYYVSPEIERRIKKLK